MSMRTVCLLALSVLIVSGCRFKQPSIDEQRALIEEGAFPAGVPPWVTRVAIQGQEQKRSSFGIIPESFSGPSSVSIDLPEPGAAAAQEQEREEKEEKQAEGRKQAAVEQGPIDRVISRCPSVENDLAKALTTTESRSRERQFSMLTSRCPMSADLWFWLGQTFASEGKKAEARNAFEEAIALDPQHKEARQELGALLVQEKKKGKTAE